MTTSLQVPATTTAGTSAPASGFILAYVPFVRTSDSGTYFCAFYDGSGALASASGTTLAAAATSSTFFQLTVTTLNGSSSAKSISRSKSVEYSLVILGASKILL
ncbi:hypothetical protein DAPPUDRAFT_343167 [Daphnia pulex]|uniref:Ig-like domain-containing protein n=1 Tax=Daphnia pulex TaxID=6669 RepID=E9I698_DAPPU|nr:hypothetical protein DAPPUDRAFT_343167 [Daphnia pulex]|eukprot:EFX60482.1 hypothetical protein DAPPUDRAFT_343167 [Daphnia pulex]